jgi:hypothetical protein
MQTPNQQGCLLTILRCIFLQGIHHCGAVQLEYHTVTAGAYILVRRQYNKYCLRTPPLLKMIFFPLSRHVIF